jgi:hypothetical protein
MQQKKQKTKNEKRATKQEIQKTKVKQKRSGRATKDAQNTV